MRPKIYAFTGKMYSGKDFVVNQTGMKHFSLSEPIHDIVAYMQGTEDKSTPGVRQAMQRAGKWGRGEIKVSDGEGPEILKVFLGRDTHRIANGKWAWVDWREFGTPDFWLNIVRNQAARISGTESACAVSSIRWPNELAWNLSQGGVHVHIMCSEETRRARMADAGYTPHPAVQDDLAEKMVNELDASPPSNCICVWNDIRPKPAERYLTVLEFLATIPQA